MQGVAAAATLALSAVTNSGELLSCGAAPSAEAAMRRLNEARLRGATCRPGTTSTAVPLTWSESLAAAAQVQAAEMARLQRMTHLDSQNRSLAERLRAIGYRYTLAVENVGVGYSSLDDVVEAWLESEGHCENLMNAAVLEFGLACIDAGAADAARERRYWTLVLGAPPRPWPR
ncbi:MAG: CAP domain-containing protein [Caldimonas sp.]